jgi:hypothetical protein
VRARSHALGPLHPSTLASTELLADLLVAQQDAGAEEAGWEALVGYIKLAEATRSSEAVAGAERSAARQRALFDVIGVSQAALTKCGGVCQIMHSRGHVKEAGELWVRLVRDGSVVLGQQWRAGKAGAGAGAGSSRSLPGAVEGGRKPTAAAALALKDAEAAEEELEAEEEDVKVAVRGGGVPAAAAARLAKGGAPGAPKASLLPLSAKAAAASVEDVPEPEGEPPLALHVAPLSPPTPEDSDSEGGGSGKGTPPPAREGTPPPVGEGTPPVGEGTPPVLNTPPPEAAGSGSSTPPRAVPVKGAARKWATKAAGKK